MNEEKPVRINVALPADLHAWLRMEAFRRRVTLGELVERLLSQSAGMEPAQDEEGNKRGTVYGRPRSHALVLADQQR